MSAEPATWDRAAAAGAVTRRAPPLARLLRFAKITGISVVLLTASIGGYWGILQYEGNFHTVIAGQLYRSAQPSREDLATAVHQYGIRSVINLRGPHIGQSWYDNEIDASKKFGLSHYDFGMSAKRTLTSEQIHELLAVIRSAPKPLLIHCQSGADRTGLVSALYRYAETGATAAEADKELSLIYGHFPYLTSRSGAMDQTFWAYVRGQDHAAAH